VIRIAGFVISALSSASLSEYEIVHQPKATIHCTPEPKNLEMGKVVVEVFGVVGEKNDHDRSYCDWQPRRRRGY
jgi:hypothetical protein